MKFLCDVHISYKIVRFLSDSGFHSIHINEIFKNNIEWIKKVNANSRFIIEIDRYNVTYRISD